MQKNNKYQPDAKAMALVEKENHRSDDGKSRGYCNFSSNGTLQGWNLARYNPPDEDTTVSPLSFQTS